MSVIRFTADEFQEEFGKKIGDLIEIRKHVTEGHKIMAMQNPAAAVLKAEFGKVRLSEAVTHLYMVECAYWIEPKGSRFRAQIQAITIYETEDEYFVAMAEMERKEKPPVNLN